VVLGFGLFGQRNLSGMWRKKDHYCHIQYYFFWQTRFKNLDAVFVVFNATRKLVCLNKLVTIRICGPT
jgi:hypothetical protein